MIGWYHFVESKTGFKAPVFTKQDNSTAFLEANESIQLLCKKYNHRYGLCRVDATKIQNSDQCFRELAELGIAVKPAVPRRQRQNPAERDLQGTFNCVTAILASQKILGPAFYDHAVRAHCLASNAVTIHEGYSAQAWMTGASPDMNDFRFPFGTPIGSFEQMPNDPKFKMKGQFAVSLDGTLNGNHGTMVYIPGRGMKPFVRFDVRDLKILQRPLPTLLITSVASQCEFDSEVNEGSFVSHVSDKSDEEYAAIQITHDDVDSSNYVDIPSDSEVKEAIKLFNMESSTASMPRQDFSDLSQDEKYKYLQSLKLGSRHQVPVADGFWNSKPTYPAEDRVTDDEPSEYQLPAGTLVTDTPHHHSKPIVLDEYGDPVPVRTHWDEMDDATWPDRYGHKGLDKVHEIQRTYPSREPYQLRSKALTAKQALDSNYLFIEAAIQCNEIYYERLNEALLAYEHVDEEGLQHFNGVIKLLEDVYIRDVCFREVIDSEGIAHFAVRAAKRKLRTADNPTLRMAVQSEVEWERWLPVIKLEIDQLLSKEVY